MLRKIVSVVMNLIFPKTHLEVFIENCSMIQFEHKTIPRPQMNTRMFYPFYYKDKFVQDCIIELKERNNIHVAKKFAEILGRWVVKHIHEIGGPPRRGRPSYYLVSIPQHISKTKEKGFCHTTTLTREIYTFIQKKYRIKDLFISPCIKKYKNIKKLHTTHNKKRRFALIKNSMCAYITKSDAQQSYFFIIDDVYTTGATFKEASRSLLESGVHPDHIFYIAIAH